MKLMRRNVFVSGRRTSIRLEPAMWDAFEELCRREGRTLHAVCSQVEENRGEQSLTRALRIHILSYFRSAATEAGHIRAGHGCLLPVQSRHPLADMQA
jgi:predicted DNA-binding ribbon-helix-helix protein